MSMVRALLKTGCRRARGGNGGIAQAWGDAGVIGGLKL